MSQLVQETFLGTIPSQDPPLTEYVVLNTSNAGEGVTSSFVELTFNVTAGGSNDQDVRFTIEVIQATNSSDTQPVFMTQWNHRQWAIYGVSRGYLGIVYPGADTYDASPLFQKV